MLIAPIIYFVSGVLIVDYGRLLAYNSTVLNLWVVAGWPGQAQLCTVHNSWWMVDISLKIV